MARRGVALALGLVAAVLVVLAAGGLWWWALLRLVLLPDRAGPVEGAVVAGGWGLSLLPVHVTAHRARRASAPGSAGGDGTEDGRRSPGGCGSCGRGGEEPRSGGRGSGRATKVVDGVRSAVSDAWALLSAGSTGVAPRRDPGG